jgi:hypothetical protein
MQMKPTTAAASAQHPLALAPKQPSVEATRRRRLMRAHAHARTHAPGTHVQGAVFDSAMPSQERVSLK